MRTLTTTLALLCLFAGAASAQQLEFSKVPDLVDLVAVPLRAEYVLTCREKVSGYLKNGWEKVDSPAVKITGTSPVIMTLLIKNWNRIRDPIAKYVMVDVCLETKTDYVIEADRAELVPRTVDWDIRWGPRPEGAVGPSYIPQKTRTRP